MNKYALQRLTTLYQLVRDANREGSKMTNRYISEMLESALEVLVKANADEPLAEGRTLVTFDASVNSIHVTSDGGHGGWGCVSLHRKGFELQKLYMEKDEAQALEGTPKLRITISAIEGS